MNPKRAPLVPWWSAARKHFRNDPHVGPLVQEFKGDGLRCQNDLFHTLCRSVVGQQISVKAADTVWSRFHQTVRRINPSSVLTVSEHQLRAAGLSRRKASYILGIASEAKSLQRTKWEQLDDEAAINRLAELRGIGRWTAEMALIFSMGRRDIFPIGDVGLIRAAERALGRGDEPAPFSKIESAAKGWRPYRTAATWFLWRSIDPVPVEY